MMDDVMHNRGFAKPEASIHSKIRGASRSQAARDAYPYGGEPPARLPGGV